jgi:tRNA(fMet)-specific endonuclease VapC
MDFVLDTNIVVHFVRNDAYARQLEQQFAPFSSGNHAFISIVSVGEIRSLAFQFRWGEEKIARMNLLLHLFNPYPVESEEIAAAYADLDAYSQCVHPLHPPPLGLTARNMGKTTSG